MRRSAQSGGRWIFQVWLSCPSLTSMSRLGGALWLGPAQSSLCPALKPLKLLTPSSRRNRSNKHQHKPAKKYPAVLETRDRAEVHQSYLLASKTVKMSWAGFKKNVNRATTQVMMKTGHVEKTNDRDYEVEERLDIGDSSCWTRDGTC